MVTFLPGAPKGQCTRANLTEAPVPAPFDLLLFTFYLRGRGRTAANRDRTPAHVPPYVYHLRSADWMNTFRQWYNPARKNRFDLFQHQNRSSETTTHTSGFPLAGNADQLL